MAGRFWRFLELVFLAMCTTYSGTLIAEPVAVDTTRLTITLTAPTVPARVRRYLEAEAQRIWRRERIELSWCDRQCSQPDRRADLRVALLANPRLSSSAHDGYSLAELHREGRLIVVSLEAARSVVRAGLEHADNPGWPLERNTQALGRVLGRAVAHEIGHYLLGTSAHARTGLMRAEFTPREFVDPHGSMFELSGESAREIARRRVRADSTPPAVSTH
jgi:hypothetical protein